MKNKGNDSQERSPFPKIGAPATRALEAAGYPCLEQLTNVTQAEPTMPVCSL